MSKLIIPAGYKSKLSARETQKAIKLIKDNFQVKLASRLNLDRITAPIIVESKSGINDDLNGVERKVKFDLKVTGTDVEVVQSLAKWKRIALHKYGYSAGEGIYTDMNALRRDDDMDNTHSVFHNVIWTVIHSQHISVFSDGGTYIALTEFYHHLGIN